MVIPQKQNRLIQVVLVKPVVDAANAGLETDDMVSPVIWVFNAKYKIYATQYAMSKKIWCSLNQARAGLNRDVSI